MQNLINDLTELLSKDGRFVSDGKILKNSVIESALKLDSNLINLLLSNETIKSYFFTEVDGTFVFDKERFQRFISNKQFLADSYTVFKNKIGLTVDDEFVSEGKNVVLSWPYKDCFLEGGQEKEDEKRNEVFWNEVLAPNEIDRLLSPKVFNNWRKYEENGETKVTTITEKDNFIIKGNNLLVLASLLKKFRGKVKLIYIDPPYNTGSDEFNYNDKFNHSTWLTFMRNRLRLARDLLAEDGSIFVQIDHHELSYLNVLMDEIFGRENFVQIITVKTSSPAGFKTVNPGLTEVTEYILFYTKDKAKFNFRKSYVPTDYDKNYDMVITNIDDEPTKWKLRPLRDIIYEQNDIKIGSTPQQSAKNAKKKWGEHWKIIRHQLMGEYALENAERVVSIRDPQKPTERLKALLDKSKVERDRIFIYEKTDGSGRSYIINGGALSFYSNKIREIDGKMTPTELLSNLWTDISWDGIANEGKVKLKNGKKPERLLKRIIEYATDKGDLVLDFFLGSGTTAAVAHKMNRQYIGVEQLDYGKNDSHKRLINVIDGESGGISKVVKWKGGGSFIYCELAKLNQKFIDKIQLASTKKELTKLWNWMQENAFLSYKVNVKEFNKHFSEFEELSIEQQKKLLIEMLDKNHLYINYSEIDDEDYDLDYEVKSLNRLFYEG